MQFDLVEFRAVVERNRANRQNRNFPDRTDDRAVDGCLFPRITPKFTLDFSKPLKVFTIGSCFARNIEDVLLKRGVTLPTAAVRTPKGEMPHGRLVLNEFTPGTMAQRIQYGLNAQPFSLESLVPSGDDRVADLLLHGLTNKTKFDVSYERGVERRGQIDAIYRELRTADVVILTLGFVEAWFDAHTNLYLNRVPPMHFAARNPGRFHLVRLDVHQSLSLLDGAIRMLSDLSIKTILTISPVPLHTTFTPVDCVIANEYSKSVLRVCADELCRRYDSVDYFPSYEIVRSGGLQNFVEDNVHVKEEVVALIADYMMSMYSMDAQDISVLAAVSAEAVTGKS